jgi:hypothetical protein
MPPGGKPRLRPHGHWDRHDYFSLHKQIRYREIVKESFADTIYNGVQMHLKFAVVEVARHSSAYKKVCYPFGTGVLH